MKPKALPAELALTIAVGPEPSLAITWGDWTCAGIDGRAAWLDLLNKLAVIADREAREGARA